MARDPVAAGEFYEDDFGKLDKQVKACFMAKQGPGAMPVSRIEEKIKGVLVPHGKYDFSGPCAAWAYKEIAEADLPDAYVLLGPNNFGNGTGISIEDWKTPFGIVKNHKDIVRDLKEKTSLKITEENHVTEHALEVQLPFLQVVNKDLLSRLRIVPITIDRNIRYEKVAKEISKALAKRDIVFIVATSLTRYGPRYNYVPFESDLPKRISHLDKQVIDFIKRRDVEGFAGFINKQVHSMTGYMPLLVFMSIMEDYDAHLLMHYMSGDLTGEYRNSESYASMVFK